jgi:hypothetical protein
VNQCQGCQAGWPLDERRPDMHVTAYPSGHRELVACTRDRYEMCRHCKRSLVAYDPRTRRLVRTVRCPVLSGSEQCVPCEPA